MSLKFLPLMRVGTFKDRHGVNYDITKSVLEKLAQTFNPARPPHILVGHPDTDKAPSFGIVDALKVVGDKLFFRPGKVCAEFAALVRRGGFPSVSAGLTRDLSRLDHVAFLSAQKPAIDGLAPIAEFSASADAPTDAIDVTDPAAAGLAEFAALPDWWVTSRIREIAGLLRNLKNEIIERKGTEAADALLPEHTLGYLQADPPPVEEPEAGEAEFAGEADEAARLIVAEIDTVVKERDRLAARVAELEKQARLAEFGAFVEERIAEGKVLPDQKQATIDTMEALHNSVGAEFSGGAAPVPNTLEVYRAEIKSRPRIAPVGSARPPEFAGSGGALDGVALGQLARRYQEEMAAKGVTVNVIDAVNHVTNNITT